MYYWVNQGKTYKEEKQGGYLWAPVKNNNGNSFFHWQNMAKLKPNDIVFNFKKGFLVGYCTVASKSYLSQKPSEFNVDVEWENDGLMVDAYYQLFKEKMDLEKVYKEIEHLLPSKYSPINNNGYRTRANQGYLYELSQDIGDKIFDLAGLNYKRDVVSIQPNTLIEVKTKPKPYIKKSNRSSKVKERKEDYITKAITNKETGDAGEFLVLDLEKIKLSKSGIDKEPEHIAAIDDYAGYDILSYDETGNEIYIEVKTTKHSLQTPFYVSPNEVKKSIEYKDQYYLYRLYDYNKEDNTALFYKAKGPLDNSYELEPTNYIARYTGDYEED